MSPLEVRRLALIKYTYGLAVKQSRQPGELAGVSVLQFHDSVELFLQLAAEKVGANTSEKTAFAEYFSQIEKSPQTSVLHQRQAMQSMNKARVAFKHGGSLPSRTTIEVIRANVATFFEENTRLIFGVEFETISLLDLVPYPRCKKYLEQSAECLRKGDYYGANGNAHIAFLELIEEYGEMQDDLYRVPYFSSPPLSERRASGVYPAVDAGVRADNAVISRVNALQEAVQLLTLGIDYRKFRRFNAWKPAITSYRIDGGGYYLLPQQEGTRTPPADQAKYSFEFVLVTAISLETSE